MDWHSRYMNAVELEEYDKESEPILVTQQTRKVPTDKVLEFLDLLLTHEGGECWMKQLDPANQTPKKNGGDPNATTMSDKNVDQFQMMKNRLASVATRLLIQMPELNASGNSKAPRVSKVRVLQLQLVCRVLCYGALNKRRKEKKRLKNEIRGLMDRVALLLDAANPPSLAVEDGDERSPFQKFLQQELASRFRLLVPELMRYLLTTYELEDNMLKDGDDNDALSTRSTMAVKPLQVFTDQLKGVEPAKQNIVAALLQERTAKRARSEVSGLFKEFQLPSRMQQKQMQSAQTLKRVSKNQDSSSTRSSSTDENKSTGYSTRMTLNHEMHSIAGSKLMQKFKNRDFTKSTKTGQKLRESILQHTAARSRVKKPSNPLLVKAMPERALQQSAIISSTKSPARDSIAEKTQPQPMYRAKATSLIVMRTPDRPKRMAVRALKRVLVDASPPLRKPKGIGSKPHLLQPNSTRSSRRAPALFN
ncbi:uncharacterized protein PHALS_11393 [Plasmopara halstedii]|uniref:Uncharacterized protein n=1 Tax=Plasmopara halstedii TaxID=4781 RepID=A0A0N7L3C8_PLAHL|nr:uncharacterized protein PHALS_11393 [Plasmopara halstedii]CEG35515.1 hypothetical protein PHALS_11393 [Plasmopara halstedii]|eukprot:XP_024571884.1 hypothetical protein PHALS_11393 [Plasmopara halstedii]